ncbi:MAG: hypothetical protein H7123_06050, partial [Thermoleophilia bacterium]|nr:hypothetical protein [Thermoleophilia bacterium]
MNISGRSLSVTVVLAFSLTLGLATATAYAAARPNLVVMAVKSLLAPVYRGGTVTATYTVTSRKMRARSTTSGLYLSTDKLFSRSDRLLASASVPAIRLGMKLRRTFTGTLPAAVSGGSYFLIVCVDRRQVVRESRENDNCHATAALTVSSKSAPPLVMTSTPISASSNDAPVVSGTAPETSTVNVYATTGCTGPALGTGDTNADGSFDVTLTSPVLHNATSTLHATATGPGTRSICSPTSVAYVHDDIAPAMAADLTTTPAGTSGDSHPVVTGATDAFATVDIYNLFELTGCGGAIVGTGTADELGTFAVAPDSLHPLTSNPGDDVFFAAIAKDPAGNASPCSTPSAPAYRFDQTIPTFNTLVSPSTNNDPILSGVVNDLATTVKYFTNGSCSGGGSLAVVNHVTGQWTATPHVGDNTSTTFTVQGTLNAVTGACSE